MQTVLIVIHIMVVLALIATVLLQRWRAEPWASAGAAAS